MTEARELLKTGPEEIKLSSGVTVRVAPFPAGLWTALNARAFEKFPDPELPKKTIPVVDGTEEVDDLSNPEYLEAKAQAARDRNNLLGEAIIDLCIQVDLEPWEGTIGRLGKYSDEYPEDADDRRVRFLTEFALRTRADYEAVMVSATTQMMVSDPEVAQRLKFFRRQVAGAAPDDADAPGSAKEERVEVQPEAEGA